MSIPEAKLVPANNSVVLEDVYNKNDEIAETNDKLLIPDKKKTYDNDTFKKYMQNQLEEVISEKKEKFYKFKMLEKERKNCLGSFLLIYSFCHSCLFLGIRCTYFFFLLTPV